MPAKFTIDGDPSEWADEAQAPSRVAVAVSSKSVFLVGRVAAAAGTTVTVAFHHDPLTSPKNKVAQFTRVLHVDANGVTADDPALSKALAAATFNSSKTPQGFQFEAELPLDVLPRLVSVPLGALGVAAASGATAPERFVSCSLPMPVEFEPNAIFRRWVFGLGAARIQNAGAVLTYSAIDGDHVDVLQKNDRGTVDVTERTLYRKLGGDADVEFGVVDLVGPTIIARVRGAVTGEIHLSALPKTFAKKKINGRDGWLGVAPKIEPANQPELPGATTVLFDTVFIGVDGNLAEGLFPPYTAFWKDASPTISTDLASLSVKGTLYEGATPKPGSFRWKLNAQTGYQLIE